MLSATARPPAVRNKPTVLFVDDEQRVLTSMRALFRRIYRVKTALSAAAALDIMREHAIDVVVSDQRMPEMSGVEFLGYIKHEYPQTMRILLTGYADLEAIEASINEGEVFRYLVKPCPPDDLKRVVEMAAEAAQAEYAHAAPEVAEAPVALRVADVEFADEPEFPVLTDQVPLADVGQTPAADERVDVLVLSRDDKVHAAVLSAMATEQVVHNAQFLDEALDLMTQEPIGVLVTDLAVNEHEVSLMTRELKQYVPELVTILASDRSDANLLIDLINQGQVFRFLLKPIPKAQCRIWVRSAANKHRELINSPEALLRHVVDDAPEVLEQEFEAFVEEPAVADTSHAVEGVFSEEANADSAVSANGGSAWSDRAGNVVDLRRRIQEKSKAVAQRMTDSILTESGRAMGALRDSGAARSLSTQYSAIKQRISQWKASNG